MICKVRMKKNSAIIASFVLILLMLSTSGCLDFFNINDGSTTYESHPTKIQYNIGYGYWINFSGTGEHLIDYDCDKPETLIGKVSSESLLYKKDCKNKTLANNIVINWNISGTNNNNYKLGIAANVTAESFLIPDLSGDGASSLQEIKTNYPIIFNQYCHEQSANGTVYIDPNNNIKSTAQNVSDQTDNNNSFILAKELFIWLKQNTIYLAHNESDDSSVQPAGTTYRLKTGDCDDLSFLYISLCRSLGIPVRFIKGCLVEETDGVASAVAHAWAEVFVGGNIGNKGWIPVECAGSSDMVVQVNQNFGVESVGHLRLFEDDGSNESMDAYISGPMARYDTGMKVEMTAFVEIYNYSVLESKELTVDKNGNRAYK